MADCAGAANNDATATRDPVQDAPGPGPWPGGRYRRIARHRGRRKALVAVGRSILTIIWHLLADPETRFTDLGADHYDSRRSTTTKERQCVRELEALGYRVTLEPAA